jgi:hypothetical protein
MIIKGKSAGKAGAGAGAKATAKVSPAKKKAAVSPQAKGRVIKAQNEGYAAASSIADKLMTQSRVQNRIEGLGGRISGAKASGMKAAIPSPHYWGGSKRKATKAEEASNAAVRSYTNLAKRGK